MVPGLATEEFSTPPSSPLLASRTRNKAAVPITDLVDYKSTARDPSNDLQDNIIQLGELLLKMKKKFIVTVDLVLFVII